MATTMTVPDGGPPRGWRALVGRVVLTGLRATLWFSPRPMVWVLRREFAKNGAALGATATALQPSAVSVALDERYDAHPRTRLDVYAPASVSEGVRLPTIVWTHGGGWVAGSKEELRDHLRLLADQGFTVVAIEYDLAPEARYPTPVRQLMAALAHVVANAERLHVDADRLLLAGDSAGAHIAAQAAAIVTDPAYGQQVGVKPTIEPAQLRGVVLCCGPYDLRLVDPSSPMRDFIRTVAWAYSGHRDFRTNQAFVSTVAVTDHLTAAFPPTFLTVGNADPLRTHSEALASELSALGVEVDTLFPPADHQPPLGHEYQFDLRLPAARTALDRLVEFCRRSTNGS